MFKSIYISGKASSFDRSFLLYPPIIDANSIPPSAKRRRRKRRKRRRQLIDGEVFRGGAAGRSVPYIKDRGKFAIFNKSKARIIQFTTAFVF